MVRVKIAPLCFWNFNFTQIMSLHHNVYLTLVHTKHRLANEANQPVEADHAGHARHQNCRVRSVQHFWAVKLGDWAQIIFSVRCRDQPFFTKPNDDVVRLIVDLAPILHSTG